MSRYHETADAITRRKSSVDHLAVAQPTDYEVLARWVADGRPCQTALR